MKRMMQGLPMLIIVLAAGPAYGQQPAPRPPEVQQPEQFETTLRLCVIVGGELSEVEAAYLPGSGDTIVVLGGELLPFAEAYPDSEGYAAGKAWFNDESTIGYRWRRYRRTGTERLLAPTDLRHASEHEGVPIFASRSFSGIWPDVLYLPIRPGCSFQPYQPRGAP
ncbi:MAG: hypothetical protein WD737_04330 [Gemmatimonadota bacterium]